MFRQSVVASAVTALLKPAKTVIAEVQVVVPVITVAMPLPASSNLELSATTATRDVVEVVNLLHQAPCVVLALVLAIPRRHVPARAETVQLTR